MTWCDLADPFADGELDADAAAPFRAHLPACRRCRRRVYDLMMLEVVGQTTVLPPATQPLRPIASLSWFRQRRSLGPKLITTATALAAVAVLVIVLMRPRPDAQPIVLALAPTRALEPRLSWPGADRYRAHAVTRAAGTRVHEAVSFAALERLRARGDLRGGRRGAAGGRAGARAGGACGRT
jgi:hypothetical protein